MVTSTTHSSAWLRPLLSLALPIALQTAVFSSKSMIDTVMLGSLSEMDIAAIGFAGKIQLVLTFFVIGISIGGGQVAAQCAGEGSTNKLLRSIMITLLLSLAAATLFAIPLMVWSEHLMALGTSNTEIITRGASYLVIIASSLLLFAVTSTLATALRVIHQPLPATIVSLVGVAINVGLNYLLIFGVAGLPALGIKGAAIGTLVSAVIETALLVGYLAYRRHAVCQLNRQLLSTLTVKDIKVVLSLATTAALNSVVWALGLFAFHAILGSRDDNLLIALGVLAPIESLAMALLIGLASAAAVMVGNQVGAQDSPPVERLIPKLLLLSAGMGIVICGVLMAIKPDLLSYFYAQSSDAAQLTAQLYDLVALSIIVKSLAMMLIMGILRAGGDAKFCLYTDVFAQWILLLPLALLLAYLGLPNIWLFSLIFLEEGIKIALCVWRLLRHQWCHNYAAAMQG